MLGRAGEMLPSVHRLGAPPRTLDITRDEPKSTPNYQPVGENYNTLVPKEPKKKTPDRRVDVEVSEPGFCWLCCLLCCE